MAPKAFKRSDRRHSTRQTMVVRSLRAYRHSRQVHVKTGNLGEVDPFVYARCIQTIFPIDGRPKPLTPGTEIEYTVPDMYGRPWARIWERYFE